MNQTMTTPDGQRWWLVDLPHRDSGADLTFHRLVTGVPGPEDQPGPGQALVAFPAEAIHVSVELDGQFPIMGFGLYEGGHTLPLDSAETGRATGNYIVELSGLGITTLNETVAILNRMGFRVTWTRTITPDYCWRIGVEPATR